MTDLELTRLCAEAIQFVPYYPDDQAIRVKVQFDPLHDDAQAMALVKKFHPQINKTLRTPEDQYGQWLVSKTDRFVSEPSSDLNRAIVECVARMQQAKARA